MQNAIQSLLNIVIDQKEPSPAVIVCSTSVEARLAQRLLYEHRKFVGDDRSVYMLVDPESGLIRIRHLVCDWKLRKASVMIVTIEVLKLMQRDGTALGHHRFTNYVYVGYDKDADAARESGLFSATLTAPNSTFNGFAGITFSESFDAASFLGVSPVKGTAPAKKAIDNNVDDDDEDDWEPRAPSPKIEAKTPAPAAKAPKAAVDRNINLPRMSGPWPTAVRQQLIPNLLAVLARAVHATNAGRKVVIHSRTSGVVSWLAKSLTEAGVQNYQLTSSTARSQYPKILAYFKTSGPSVLIATDVIRSGMAIYAGVYALEVYSVYPVLEVYHKQFEAVFKRYNIEAPVFVHLWNRHKEAPLLGQSQTIQDMEADLKVKARLLEEGRADWQAVVDESRQRGDTIKTLQSAVNVQESRYDSLRAEKNEQIAELKAANADIAQAVLLMTDRLQAAEAEVARLKAKYEPKTIAQQMRENANGAGIVQMSGVQFENLLQFMEALEGFAGKVKVSHNEGLHMQVLAAQVLKDSCPE